MRSRRYSAGLEAGDRLCYCSWMPTATDKLNPDDIALFLDVDGTLLGIRDDPSAVFADAKMIGTLAQCFDRLDGAMALVSGRSVAEIDRMFAPAVFPVAGSHGSELRFHRGETVRAAEQGLPQEISARLEAFAARHDGLLLEKKPGGVSLHYRRAPALQAECRQLAEKLLGQLGDSFRLISGKMVFEIAPSAHDKGAAIRTFLQEPPFARRTPVFLGDDVTDEDGFRVVNALGGMSVRIGDIEHSEARYQLADVTAVEHWLREAILAGAPAQCYGENCS